MAHDTQTLSVITIDDYECDVACQFTYLGSANNANLSCSSKDSSVGKPRAVGEDKIWQSTMPVGLRMDATSVIKHVTPALTTPVLALVWTVWNTEGVHITKNWSLQPKPPAASAEQAVSNIRMNHPWSSKIDKAYAIKIGLNLPLGLFD